MGARLVFLQVSFVKVSQQNCDCNEHTFAKFEIIWKGFESNYLLFKAETKFDSSFFYPLSLSIGLRSKHWCEIGLGTCFNYLQNMKFSIKSWVRQNKLKPLILDLKHLYNNVTGYEFLKIKINQSTCLSDLFWLKFNLICKLHKKPIQSYFMLNIPYFVWSSYLLLCKVLSCLDKDSHDYIICQPILRLVYHLCNFQVHFYATKESFFVPNSQ